jgi:peptidoglycan/LPS O-acetylase OafA/YrhL
VATGKSGATVNYVGDRLGYVPALDGIRAIAILLVLGLHAFNLPPGGATGVDLFFVLSGFLITTLLLEERAATGGIALRSFYLRRARRLFPALAVFLAFHLAVTGFRGGNALGPVAVGAFYMTNIAIATGHPSLVTGLGRLWSLAQEEQFYLLWPWLLLLFAKSRRLVVWIFALSLALAVYRAVLVMGNASANRIYYAPDTRADGLILGALLAAARLRWRFTPGEWAGKCGVAVIVPAALFGWLTDWWAIWGEPLFEVGVALLIAAAISQTELARALSSKPLVWIGQRSYSLYLWSGLLIGLSFSYLGHSYPARVIAVIGVFVFASLSYRFVEQPFRRRRRTALDPPALPAPAVVFVGEGA